VRGVSSTGVRGSWALASFEVGDHAAPSLVSPGNGAPLQQPDEPVLLTWTPAQGAIGYTIEVDDDDRFLTPSGTYTSSLTSFLLPDPGLEQTYYWHVRANFSGNISSRWSAPNNFTVLGLAAPALTAPDDSATSQVTDAVLDWKPVAGAVKYEVQVSTDQEFNSFDDKIEVKSTRYARPVTLNNDQYWWRVRAVDVNGNQSPWTIRCRMPATTNCRSVWIRTSHQAVTVPALPRRPRTPRASGGTNATRAWVLLPTGGCGGLMDPTVRP
jgi:predicted phage tail protein